MQCSGQERGGLRLVKTCAQEVLSGGQTIDFVGQQSHQLHLGVRTSVAKAYLKWFQTPISGFDIFAEVNNGEML